MLVGLRAHGDLPAVARRLRALGARPEALRPIGVLAATVPSGAALVRALGADPRVAYLERDGELSIAADPFDTPDPQHGGLKFTWWYDDVRAGAALFAAGGGSRRSVAVLDTGLDVNHPEFAGSGRIARTYETNVGGQDVTDAVGHGTFVTGLIAAVDGNGVGTKGVAGNTQILAIRASANGSFTERDLLRGIDFTLRRGGDVLNLSLAGDGLGRSVGRALATAFLNDVLPVAASGNKAQDGNPIQFPAALLGGRRGDPGIGLSVAATRPDGSVGAFSTHNEYVSLAAPGASAGDCRFGVFSTLPATVTDWDDLDSCPTVFSQGGARYAYAEGTSFAAPIASGIAALVWQIERRLASEQVAEVMIRSARQTRGTGWNEFTGTGIVDGGAATALARTYDVTAPRARGSVRRTGDRVRVHVRRARDRTERGRERAGGVRYGLLVSRNGGRTYALVRSGRRAPDRPEHPPARLTRARVRGPGLRRQRQLRPPPAGPRAALEVAHRVDRRPVDARLEVQVVAEAVAGAAHVADDLALLHAGAVGGGEARLVRVAARQAAGVLDAGVVAVAAHPAHQHHAARVGGADRGARAHGDVHAGVQAAPARAEGRHHRAVHRPDQLAACPGGPGPARQGR